MRARVAGMWMVTALAGPAALGQVPGGARALVPERRAPEVLREIRGEVMSVDAATGTLTLSTGAEPLVVWVDAGTTVFLEDRTGRIEDLKAGQRVNAAYERRGEVSLAQWIELSGR